jgi:hypothetical protein
MIIIDYSTFSLSKYEKYPKATTADVLELFASALPETFKSTSRDMLRKEGSSQFVSQYGCISVRLQYGTGIERGWIYSIQLGGVYWEAIKHDIDIVVSLLSNFSEWSISRLDLQKTVLVPISDYLAFCKSAFERGCFVTGAEDSRTIYFGNRKSSQFFTRIYNRTALDPKYNPAPDGMAQVRVECEIHRISNELILEKSFLNAEFAENVFLQRLRKIIQDDDTGFLKIYFDNGKSFPKIRTVKRVVGDLEKTVDYIFKAYAPYIEAGLKSKSLKLKYDSDNDISRKASKILAVLNAKGKGGE